jgi:hypothetical protein
MYLYTGTLVKRYDDEFGTMLCESYTKDEEYEEYDMRKLDVCLGVVIDAIEDEPEVIVNWVHMCRYHHKLGYVAQEATDPDYLWEVGQL